jgi:plexin A
MTFCICGLMLSPLVRERYPINYIYGFSSEGFSYFLTTQMKQTSPSPYESKIVRVCHDDSDYYSYTEVQEKNGKQGMLESLRKKICLGKG